MIVEIQQPWRLDERLAVLIPSYQGVHKLPSMIASLAQQTLKGFEVVIVLDGSTDESENYLSQATFSFEVKIVRQENKGRAAARNTAVQHTSAELLVFLDDDVIVQPDALEKFYTNFKRGCNVQVGRIAALPGRNTELFRYISSLYEKWNRSVVVNQDATLEKPYISAANFGIRKDVFLRVGGFDERLSDSEDFELAVRLHVNGFPIYFFPDIVVQHVIHNDFSDYTRRQVEYTKARATLTLINPDVKPFLTSETRLAPWKRLVYSLFSVPLFIQLMDRNWFTVIPLPVRYRLYDIVIHAHLLRL